MTQLEAFNALLDDKAYMKKLGAKGRKEFYAYRYLYMIGKIKHLDDFLQKHGYVMISEPQWAKRISHEG